MLSRMPGERAAKSLPRTAGEHRVEVGRDEGDLILEILFAQTLQPFATSPGSPLGLPQVGIAFQVRGDGLEYDTSVCGDGA